MNLEVANRLQQLRKAKGLSQEELANILGLSRQAISKWERAETSPDTDNLICLARLYNISIDKLLDTSESMEEIKERIAQERINEIDKDKEETEETNEENETEIVEDPIDSFSEEEKELKKKADEKIGNVYLALIAFGIVGYVIIGTNTHDWSWGWILIVQALFGSGVVTGLYEEKHFSVVSFFFCMFLIIVSIREALDNGNSFSLALTIASVSFVGICSIVAIITFIIFASKNRKDLDIMYHKKRYMEQRDKFLEAKGKFDEFKKEFDKMNK